MGLKKTMQDWFQDKVALTDKNWSRYAGQFPALYRTSWMANTRLFGPLARKMAKLGDMNKDFTQGHVVPLSKNINYKRDSEDVILPVQLVQKAIRESSSRVILNECICRRGMKCKDYPIGFGCIFLGDSTKPMVDRGLAKSATVDEALAHLDKAVEMGLVCHCVWVEIESYFMGIDPKDHHKLMEICLCCPCCCVGLQNFHKLGPEFMKRFSNLGWKPASTEGCTSCGKCATLCPMKAITVNEDSITISEECIGCGICASKCPQKAIIMKQIAPMKDNILDYFWGFRPEI